MSTNDIRIKNEMKNIIIFTWFFKRQDQVFMPFGKLFSLSIACKMLFVPHKTCHINEQEILKFHAKTSNIRLNFEIVKHLTVF